MFHDFLLLAQRSPFRDMGSGFRDRREHFDPLELLPWLLVFAAVLVGLLIISRYLNGKDTRRLFNNPRALFRALCRAHGLSRSDERLLWQVAKFLELEQPAGLFLQPDRFAEASADPEFRRHQEALEALAARLFAGDEALATGSPARAAAPARASSSAGDEHADVEPAGQAAAPPAAAAQESPAPRLSEQHAVRALEALMKQIQAAREPHPSPPAAPPAAPPVETPLSTV